MARPQDIQAAAEANIIRSDELWYDDGNIVFVAQQTAFRVHKSLFARHSEFFRDTFSLPQPTDPGSTEAAESIEGCPVVRVHESAADMGLLLKTMYGGFGLLHPHCYHRFSEISALTRLSHKYQLLSLLESYANLYVAAELVTAVPSAKCVGHASTLAGCAQLPAAERMSVLDDPAFFAQPHPLGYYHSTRIPTFLVGERLCAACASAMDKRLYYLQSEVWEALPAYFGLSVDDWNLPRRTSGRA